MIHSFAELLELTKSRPRKRMAVAAAHDLEVLEAVHQAVDLGLVDAMLVGDAGKIQRLADEHGLDLSGTEIINEPDNLLAARRAVELVSTKQAQMLMKGIVSTGDLLRQVLDPEIGLRTGRLLSHVAVMEPVNYGRLLLMTDGGMIIAPTLAQKVEMVKNAISVARGLGIDQPKVAPLTAFEQLNPKMPATVDADEIRKLGEAGEFGNALVCGPMALDGAVNPEAAAHKGITHPVAGHADILLVPFIEVGNVLYKSMVFFGQTKVAGIIVGARAPIVLTSRADTPEAKRNSIALASHLAD